MHKRLLAVAVFVGVALSACSSSNSNGASSPGTTTPAATATAVGTEKPMSFYAAQYLRIGKPCVDAQAKLRTATTDEQAIARGKDVASACQEANAALLRASWPANVLADIRAEVVADGPVLGDMKDLADNADSVVRDSGPANAAANIVRADLGLPAIK